MNWRTLIAISSVICSVTATPARYEVVSGWPALPEGRSLGVCAGIGVDSHGDVLVFHRNERTWSSPFPEQAIMNPTVTRLEARTGRIRAEWGADAFIMPHGLTIDHEDNVWLTDVGRHQVFKYTADGRLLFTLGERGRPGADHTHFNLPTDVAVCVDGAFYVSDGYRNTRVVKFDASGKYQFEWGGKGDQPGQFNLPHGIALDSKGRVFVCDRTNARLQVFDPNGKYQTEWKGIEIGRPYGVAVSADDHIFVVDGGEQSNQASDHSKVVELTPDGHVAGSFGSYGTGAGQFQLGHDIAVARDGSVYVAEGKGARVQKFIRSSP
jgi:peptidylamidoglycolate lyase